MNKHTQEQLSEFMDGEAHHATHNDLIETLTRDPAMRRLWYRYHLISDVIQHQLPLHPDSGSALSSRISDVLKRDVTVIAPSPVKSRSIMNPLTSFAIAASVAVIAILGVQQYRASNSPLGTASQISSASPGQGSSPLSRQKQVSVQAVRADSTSGNPVPMSIQSDSQMSRYIMNHNEYRNYTHVQGVMPYVRMVATEKHE